MSEPIRHLFWDFDGTMYDSYPQITRAMRLALHDLGVEETEAALAPLLRVTVWHVAQRYAARAGVAPQAVLDAFHRRERDEGPFPPFEGFAECLRKLTAGGCRHYLYTHRDMGAVEQLRRDGLWGFFSDAVTRQDGFPDKPAPDALLALMKRNGLNPSACAMVGDRDIDIGSGANAGMRTILFDPEGYFPALAADLRARSMRELCDWVLRG